MNDRTTGGLTAAQATERRARGQLNRIRRSPGADYGRILARNLFTLFNLLVTAAAVALLALHDRQAGLAVSGMALANFFLGLGQEVRARQHLDRLQVLSEVPVRVLRDGVVQVLPSGEVVQDDCVLLAAGETIVADGRVLEAQSLVVDESLLTGEADSISRHPGERLLSGSFCVAGTAAYRAEAVGPAAFAHRLAAQARAHHAQLSPLQRTLDRLLGLLTVLAIVLCTAYLGLFLAGHLALQPLVSMVAATITSMIPQGLILMATLAFVLGAVRLGRLGALVQRLNAVEMMASIDTLCLDKTGTLTTNQLRLDRLYPLRPDLTEEEVRALACLFASLSPDRSSKTLTALRSALGECPGELLDQVPFRSRNRYSALRARRAEGELVLVLGACEALLPYLAEPGLPQPLVKDLQRKGQRLLLLSQGDAAAPLADFVKTATLRPLALIALRDQVRPDARAVLEELGQRGMEIRVLSGDNPETIRGALRVLAEDSTDPTLRALLEAPVLAGAELAAAADPDSLILRHRILGRIDPDQKVQVVQALQRQGRRVAMIGDGVNDVLAIKHADLGIALAAGSTAARTVAALVLEDNRFAALPETLAEGGTILRNLRRAARLFLVKNVYTLLLVLASLALQLPFPYRPQQVTLLNFLTIGLPALFITCSRTRAQTGQARGFLLDVGIFALITGTVLAAAALCLQLLAAHFGQATDALQRTLILSVLVLLSLTTLLRVLAGTGRSSLREDRSLHALALAVVPVYLLVLYTPPLATFFELTPLTFTHWAWVLAVALPAWMLLKGSDLLTGKAWSSRTGLPEADLASSAPSD